MDLPSRFTEPPFHLKRELIQGARLCADAEQGVIGGSLTMPDQPCIDWFDEEAIAKFLHDELETPILDELYPYLWIFAAEISSRIDPLHRHLVKGRHIVVTEDPKLHLVWYSDVIFIKPIPACLLNHAFWKRYLCASSSPGVPPPTRQAMTSTGRLRAALGFLRSYALLIRHPSDFRLAKDGGLLPSTDMDWTSFARFIYSFRAVEDDHVSPRFRFGQLRLSRLNYAVRLCRPRTSPDWWYYHEMYWHTGAYVERFFAPLLFLFASVATVLTAMQVMMAIPQGIVLSAKRWSIVAEASWGFAVSCVFIILVMWIALFGGIVLFTAAQIGFGARIRVATLSTIRSDALTPRSTATTP